MGPWEIGYAIFAIVALTLFYMMLVRTKPASVGPWTFTFAFIFVAVPAALLWPVAFTLALARSLAKDGVGE